MMGTKGKGKGGKGPGKGCGGGEARSMNSMESQPGYATMSMDNGSIAYDEWSNYSGVSSVKPPWHDPWAMTDPWQLSSVASFYSLASSGKRYASTKRDSDLMHQVKNKNRFEVLSNEETLEEHIGSASVVARDSETQFRRP